MRFCLTAHYRQAKTHLRRIEEAGELWTACLALAHEHGLHERVTAVLYDTAYGLRVRNHGYREAVEQTTGSEITSLTASRDLNALVEAGLLSPIGEGRGRHYVAREPVRALLDELRDRRPPRADDDPFAIAGEQLELSA